MNERVIFDAALQIADPQARQAFIEKACAGKPEMLAAVESLLKSHDAAGSFLDIPAAEQIKAGAAGNPEDSAAAVEKTRSYQAGDADGDEADETQPDLSFLQPSSKPGSIGVLGHYEVLQVLGQGGFGIVLKAFDEKLHRLVAIKVMNAQMAATSPPRKRFLREARAAAAIRHENIVQVHSVEELPLPYLVMELIDGQTLRQKLDGAGPLEVPEVLHIGRQIASGLAAAQAMGLIHRDIKPGNILIEEVERRESRVESKASTFPRSQLSSLDSQLRVKITDFGLARAADDASLTRSGTISGTPMYMAPEQALGRALDHRADLFSLGSVLYELTCGRPPFRAASTVAVLLRVAEDTPRPMQEIIPEIPDWLVAIVTKLHAKKPEDRFQTAKEVADLLARCQTELQTKGEVTCVIANNTQASRAASAPGRSEPSDAVRGLTPSGSPSLSPILSRPRLLAAATVVLILAAAIVVQRVHNTTTANLASREASAPGQAESTDSTNPDRRAAEWVLSIGGSIRINEKSQEPLAATASDLPLGSADIFQVLSSLIAASRSLVVVDLPRGPFELTYADLHTKPKVSDEGLANFKDCKNLSFVWLDNNSVSDMGLVHLKDCKNLLALGLGGTRVSDAGLAHFQDCNNLAVLGLQQTQVSDAGLVYFNNYKNLRHLNLTNTQVSDAGLANFKDCKILSDLWLSETQVSDAGLELLAGRPKLVSLKLTKTKVTEAGVKKLSAALPGCKIEWDGGVIEPRPTDSDRHAAEYVLSIGGNIKIKDNGQERAVTAVAELPREAFELTSVDLYPNAKVNDAGLSSFRSCKHLTFLNLRATAVTDAGMVYFGDCRNLTYLRLDNTQVGDAGLAHFKDCKNLTHLELSGTPVSDAGLVHFQDCKKLITLILSGCNVSGAGMVYFQGCSDLTGLRLGKTNVSDAGLVHFKDSKNLQSLDLIDTKVSDAGLAHFADFKSLISLDLGNDPNVTDAGLAHFQNCKNLEFLSFRGTKVSDAGLAKFKDCKKLRGLDLSLTQVGDQGLVQFKDCKEIDNLNLDGTQISDVSMVHLKNWNRLFGLRLTHTRVTDAALAHLSDCKNLERLDLPDTIVSDAGLADLERLPSLRLLHLTNTRISLRGHAQLKVALPKCQITWSEPNRSVAESVLALGGSVEIGSLDKPESRPVTVAADLPGDYFQVRRVSLAGVTKPLDPLRPLLALLTFPQFDRLESIDLSGSTGLDYSFLVPIHGLRELTLANAGLNDAALANLPKLNTLQRLVLDGNDIRGAGLIHLSHLPELIDLSLGHPNLTNLSAENLAELKPLKRLSLAGSGLTNAGIKHLANLTNLESLDLRRTKATTAAIDELKAALPKCQIQWDGMPNK